jgi:hypothetical protein
MSPILVPRVLNLCSKLHWLLCHLYLCHVFSTCAVSYIGCYGIYICAVFLRPYSPLLDSMCHIYVPFAIKHLKFVSIQFTIHCNRDRISNSITPSPPLPLPSPSRAIDVTTGSLLGMRWVVKRRHANWTPPRAVKMSFCSVSYSQMLAISWGNVLLHFSSFLLGGSFPNNAWVPIIFALCLSVCLSLQLCTRNKFIL